MGEFRPKIIRVLISMLLVFGLACTKKKNPNATQSPSDDPIPAGSKLTLKPVDKKEIKKEIPAPETPKKEIKDEVLETKDGFRILDEGLEAKSETREEFSLDKTLYRVYIYRIHPDKSKIKIVSFQEDASTYKTPKALRDELDAKIVINGGFFADVKKPNVADGLLMLDGKKISDINPNLSGVFAIQENMPSITETDQFKIDSNLKPDTSAIQGTPRLIDRGGKIGVAKPDLKTTKDKRLMRTAICTLPNHDFLIMITDNSYTGIYLYELALIAKDQGCDIAINLDGGPASSISVKKFERQTKDLFFSYELNIPAQQGWIHPNLIVIE